MAGKRGAGIRTKRYEKFRGVDFTTDPALVDDTRSPWAPNLIADMGGMPEKRPGWRVLCEPGDRVNGLFCAVFGGERHLLAHAGTKLYRWDENGTLTQLATGLPDARSTAAYLDGMLWLFTGGGLLRYDGSSCVTAASVAYVPTTLISCDPAGGGTQYEAINLLSGTQKVGFLADGTSDTYHLPYTDIASVDEVTVDGTALSTGWSADLNAGTVTFTSPPAAPLVGQDDNVFITFTKDFPGYADRIGKCTVCFAWGVGGASDRIVAAGNPDCPNRDYISGFGDGSYWPDTGYAVIGSDETAVMGYRRLGEQLAIVKEDNGQDSTVFLRTGSVGTDGKAVFTVKPCLAGAGATSRFGFGNIGNEQLILTGEGVCALTTNSLTAERIAQNRSLRVDPRLLKEDPAEAVSCGWNGCFLIFAGGHVYGLDGRQPKSWSGRNDTEFLYECFYWEDVPARSVLRTVDGGTETLYFGTEDGRVCRFNTDRDGMDRFSDGGQLVTVDGVQQITGGAAITAVWATRADDDGDPMVLKTLLKKGNAVTIKPYRRSSAKILFRTDRDAAAWQAAEGTMDIFDWEDIDFSRFTFNANDAPQEVPFRCKVKNYKRLQILIKNDAVNEGFGVYGIVKHFVTGNFAKK